MEPNNPFSFDQLLQFHIANVINDNTEEEMLRRYLERKEQQAENSNRHRGKRRHIERNREGGHARLFNDYFSDNPVYTDDQFRRRFRMRKHVFMRIVDALVIHDEYFQMRYGATGQPGLSPLQKCTSAIRMLAYGSSADSNDDYLRMGETTSLKCFDMFIIGVIEVFGDKYLRRPTNDDIQHLLQMGASRGFPGMLRSIDCMHCEWKNCPVAWKGQFCRGDHGKPTVMLEAVASQDLWIWHAFFGVAGSNNDINVLNQSNVFSDFLNGQAPQVHYVVNQTPYNIGYYLSDGIYPEWACFVKSIPHPLGPKKTLFAQHQEAAKKDIERAFGVLQAQFAIIRQPARGWDLGALKHVINACIILHNMIVKDERDSYDGHFDYSYDHTDNDTTEASPTPNPNFQEYLRRRFDLRDRRTHHHLQADLVQHIWDKFGHLDVQS